MDQPHLDSETADAGETSSGNRRKPASRKKIAIIAGVCVAVWITAMIIKGSGDSDAENRKDKLGRDTGGISVVEEEGSRKPKEVEDEPDRGNTKATYPELLNKIDEWNATVWAKEVETERYEAALVKAWDSVRAADDKLTALEQALPPTVILGSRGAADDLGLGIRQIQVGEPKQVYAAASARPTSGAATPKPAGDLTKLIAGFRAGQWVVEQIELRQLDFAPAAGGTPARSTAGLVIDVHGPGERRRISIRGLVLVEWSSEAGDASVPVAASVDASRLTLTVRDAEPAFIETLAVEETVDTQTAIAQYRPPWPIVLDDLDGDNLPELILGGKNLIYRNLGGGKFDEPRPISGSISRINHVGAIADFSGDGKRDFLAVDRTGHLTLFSGDGKGNFSPAAHAATIAFPWPKALTAGDIDGDGDLDLFIGQYKAIWHEGQMASPYYDANDSHPAYLLRNDGGKFTDVTETAGLAAKRKRWTNSASLVDLTDDGNLDLVVCSDFAGVDLYRGDGRGRFEDITPTLGERRSSSAAHAFADFDADGRLDLFAANESSHVARRLDKLGVGRTDMPEHTKMRTTMAYGNRMYLARDGRFEPPPLAEQFADAGGARACAALDIENDGDVDVFVGNGWDSRRSAAEIASNFWRHGIYLGSSEPDVAQGLLFANMFSGPLKDAKSHHGFEHNALLVNGGQRGFFDAAYALGVASERDIGTTLSGDIDADGRVDLILVENQAVEGALREHVYALRNRIEGGGHWIGVRLHRSPSGGSPIGAQVSLTAGGTTRVAAVVTGDSFAAQCGPVVHFGLGAAAAVDKIEIRWPDGKVDTLARPAIDVYHDVGTRE
jgi:enediyne biosynthesis protein E4